MATTAGIRETIRAAVEHVQSGELHPLNSFNIFYNFRQAATLAALRAAIIAEGADEGTNIALPPRPLRIRYVENESANAELIFGILDLREMH